MNWKTWGAVGVAVALVLGTAGVGLLAVDRPRVTSVDNDWGTVTSERTEVETQLVVDNPMVLRLGDAVADVNYTVSLNGVVVATERERRVRLSGPRDVVNVSTWLDNDDIQEWWVTHVNRNQSTTVRVDPTVALQYGGVALPAGRLTRTRTVNTGLLEPLRIERNRRLEAFGRTVLIVNGTDARLRHATIDRTPIHASATLTNPLSVPVPVTRVNYTIRMNGVVVGNGTAARGTVIPPGATRTLEARAAIDNAKLDEWWVTHLRNDETTRLSVEFDATVGFGGVERRLPLEFITYNRTVHTDVFGSDGEGQDTGEGGASDRLRRGRATSGAGPDLDRTAAVEQGATYVETSPR